MKKREENSLATKLSGKLTECSEELVVLAVVERQDKLSQLWVAMEHLQDVGSLYDLTTTRQRQPTCEEIIGPDPSTKTLVYIGKHLILVLIMICSNNCIMNKGKLVDFESVLYKIKKIMQCLR